MCEWRARSGPRLRPLTVPRPTQHLPVERSNNGTVDGMRSTIDAAGRVVVPKAIRDELGLDAGRELEITVRDQRIEIEVVPIEIEIVERDGAFAAVPATTLPPLTLEQVRDSLEGGRR